MVKNHLLVYVINPIVWHLRSWKKRMTSLTILILAPLRLLETRTCGISKRERSYSLKGKGATDVMFHLLGRPNPLFFSPYQMADNSPQQTKVSYCFPEHMNYMMLDWYSSCSSFDFWALLFNLNRVSQDELLL